MYHSLRTPDLCRFRAGEFYFCQIRVLPFRQAFCKALRHFYWATSWKLGHPLSGWAQARVFPCARITHTYTFDPHSQWIHSKLLFLPKVDPIDTGVGDRQRLAYENDKPLISCRNAQGTFRSEAAVPELTIYRKYIDQYQQRSWHKLKIEQLNQRVHFPLILTGFNLRLTLRVIMYS